MNLAIAIRAPVLPADTTPSASPSRTASIASRMLDFLPWRSAWDGLSSSVIISSVWSIAIVLRSLGMRFSSGEILRSSPNSRNRTPG